MYEAQRGDGKGKGNVDEGTGKNIRICGKTKVPTFLIWILLKNILRCREFQGYFIL